MKLKNISLEYRTLILLLGSLYSALLFMITISLSIYEDGLTKEYSRSLALVSKSIRQMGSDDLKAEFLTRCDNSGKEDCAVCSLNDKFASIVIEYYKAEDEIPQHSVSDAIELEDGTFISLFVCPVYMQMQLEKIEKVLMYVFLGVSLLFTIIVLFLNKTLFRSLKCLVKLCNDSTAQAGSVTYCPSSYEIKDLHEAITNLLVKNQSLFEKKSDMFKEIAHELKSPIAIMQARLSLLSVDDSPSNVKKYVSDTDEDIEDVKEIIYELLFLEEIEMDIQNASKSDISMKDECILMQGKFGPILELNEVKVNAPWPEDFKIHSFQRSMKKVMQAVYENVFTHTQKGTTIDVKVDSTTKTMIITNIVKSAQDRSFKSTKIGTKIIQRLSKKLNFNFEAELKGNTYITTITFNS